MIAWLFLVLLMQIFSCCSAEEFPGLRKATGKTASGVGETYPPKPSKVDEVVERSWKELTKGGMIEKTTNALISAQDFKTAIPLGFLSGVGYFALGCFVRNIPQMTLGGIPMIPFIVGGSTAFLGLPASRLVFSKDFEMMEARNEIKLHFKMDRKGHYITHEPNNRGGYHLYSVHPVQTFLEKDGKEDSIQEYIGEKWKGTTSSYLDTEEVDEVARRYGKLGSESSDWTLRVLYNCGCRTEHSLLFSEKKPMEKTFKRGTKIFITCDKAETKPILGTKLISSWGKRDES